MSDNKKLATALQSLSDFLLFTHQLVIPVILVLVCVATAGVWLLTPHSSFVSAREEIRSESFKEFVYSFAEYWKRNPHYFDTMPIGSSHQIGTSTTGCELTTATCQTAQPSCFDISTIATPSAILAPDLISGTASRSGFLVTRTGYSELRFTLCHQENNQPKAFIIEADTASRSGSVLGVQF